MISHKHLSRTLAPVQLLAAVLLCMCKPAHAQLEVSWAYTLEGAEAPWVEYWQAAGTCAVDPWGNVAIASYGWDQVTMNTNGTPLVVPHEGGGLGDGFVGRYRSDGTPSWGFWLGSTELDGATGVAMDHEGNVYVGYMFEGAFDMDPGPDSAMIAPADGDRDLAIIKYDSSGNFLHAIQLVGEYINPTAGQICRMGFDAENNLYIAGYFKGQMDIDPIGGQVLLTGNGGWECGFVAKYDPQGNLLDHLLLPSASNGSDVMDIVVDPDGSFFITGNFSYSMDLDDGPGSLLLAGPGVSCFGARYNADFSPQWGATLGGGIDHFAYTACRGSDGGYIFNGRFRGDITITLANGSQQVFNGGYNNGTTYFAALNADGQYVWFKAFEMDQRADFLRLAANEDGTFYGGFHFFGAFNMDPGASNYTVNTPGFPNYVMGMGRYTMAEGDFLFGHAFTQGGNSNHTDLQLYGSAVYLVGPYNGSIYPDIPPTSNVLTPGGLALIKYCQVPEQITYSVDDTLFICPGTDTLLVAYGADEFHWYDTPLGGDPIGVGDSLQLHSVEQSSTIYLEGLNGICVSQRIPITVILRPQVSLSADSITLCSGDTVLLSYTGLADVFAPSLPQAFSTGFVPAGDMSVWLTAMDLQNGCSVSDTAFIYVLPLPSVALQLTQDTVCLWGGSEPLGGGVPDGGTWAGEGVVNDSLWSPFESGPGVFPVVYTVTGPNGCSASATDNMSVAICFSGIGEENDPEDRLTLFPIPASNWIELRSSGPAKPITISVIDAQGRCVLRQQVTDSALQRIDISGLANGHYVMHIEPIGPGTVAGASGVSHRSFVVVRD